MRCKFTYFLLFCQTFNRQFLCNGLFLIKVFAFKSSEYKKTPPRSLYDREYSVEVFIVFVLFT